MFGVENCLPIAAWQNKRHPELFYILTDMDPISLKPKLLTLPKILDDRGNLSIIESEKHIPFKIRRCYWIYDVPGGEIRGSHAFKKQHEFIVALSGSFDVVLHNGKEEFRFPLRRSYNGLYVPPMHYRTLDNFSTNSVALVLSSEPYDPEDYIWEFDDFKEALK